MVEVKTFSHFLELLILRVLGKVEEKTFSHFLELPSELSMMMIDKMEPEDRCRMSRTSRSCNVAAKASKNYIYGLAFYKHEKKFYIDVRFREHSGPCAVTDNGYTLVFEAGRIFQYMKYGKPNGWEILYVTRLGVFVDIYLYAINYFKNLLQKYEKSIKYLWIDVGNVTEFKDNFDFGIQNLKNLEHLILTGNIDIGQFLPKTRKCLKILQIKENIYANNFQPCEEIYKVSEKFMATSMQFNDDEFSQLYASDIFIGIGSQTPENIFNFIDSWRNGRFEKRKVVRVWWDLNGSTFDARELFRLLGEDDFVPHYKQIKIERCKVAGKRATLTLWSTRLMFGVYNVYN